MRLIGKHNDDNPRIRIGGKRHVFVLNHRYEALSILNDIFIGVFFTAGSILFYFSSLQNVAIMLFLLGSIDFLLRPVIRLARRMHIVDPDAADAGDDSYEY